MFLLLSKTLDWLVSPLSWALCLLALALLFRKRPRRSLGLVATAGAVLCLFASDPVANGLQRWVEAGAESTIRPGVTYDAVLVLGGIIDPQATERSGQVELSGAGERALLGFDLVRSGWAEHVVLSAGTLDPAPDAVPEATVLARQLELWGLDASRVVEEPRSRNTRENAVECARLARERGWTRLVVVTSAAHLPRALGCFRALGLEPDAFPCDHRATGKARGLAPRAGNLSASADALRELWGRVVYRVIGYSK